MPIATIQVSEYECVHCGHKWINRVNGKDGPFPKNCAKCKRKYWNGFHQDYGYPDRAMTEKEKHLRRRLFLFDGRHRSGPITKQYRLNELCKTFLNLKPRPTVEELEQALLPLGWDPRNKGLDHRLLKEETAKRKEIMRQIIKSRGVDVNKL